MGNPELQGVFGVVPTPLTEKGEVDEQGLAHLVVHCRESGLHAAVILGSNGEFPYFTTEEKLKVLAVAAQAAQGKLPLIAGASAFSTREAVLLARAARSAGYHAVLAALNVYFQLGLEAVKEHFEALADEGGLPVIFYYFPEVTGLMLAPDEIAELAALPGIHGAKITVMSHTFIKRIVKLTRTKLWAVFAGSSFLMEDTLKMGGAGVICPIPLIAPKDCLDLYQAMGNGKFSEAQELPNKLLGALPLFTEIDMPGKVASAWFKAMQRKPYLGPPDRPVSSVVMVKEALRLQGHPITSVVRGPNQQITKERSKLVKKTLKEQGWL
ncbi:MAG TPA: dihydrodipicolinate synthase family protein [bacterium]|nr:dihydrodipicolinate synthase family protein [bacterium]